MRIERIAVIGAGIAGLTAARGLVRTGRDVSVFDKARGVGGRTSTRRTDTDAFDHGAQYFTCQSASFREQVERWIQRGVISRWHARIGLLDHGAITRPEKRIERYVGVPGMNALAKDLARDLPVEVAERIVQIEGTAGNWKLIGERGSVHSGFEAVVVATPAPQAVSLLSHAPRLQAQAARIEMHPCHAAMVVFEERVPLDLDGAFICDSPLSWAARNANKPGRLGGEAWVLHACTSWSRRHLEEDPQPVAEALVRAFAKAADRPLPRVVHLAGHRWRFARTVEAPGTPLHWDAEAQVGVCGDWTDGERIEDAFTSGARLAHAISARSCDRVDSIRAHGPQP